MIRVISFLLALALSFTVVAQTTQPTYVRPSNGAALDVKATFASTDFMGATPLISPVFDFSAFQSAIVAVKMAQNNCTKWPMIRIFGGPSATAITTDFPISAPNADFRVTGTDTVFYVVSPISSFIKIAMQKSDITGPGFNAACNVSSLTVTPVPFISPLVVSQSARQNIVQLAVTATVIFPSTLPSATRSRQTVFVQNQSTDPIFCGFDNLSTTNYAFVLPGGTAAANGTGGARELKDFAGFLFCLVDAAAVCLPAGCNVSAYTY